MFVVLKMQDFEIESINCPLPFTVDKGKMVGYLPVYNTREDALSEFPGSNIAEIQEVVKR